MDRIVIEKYNPEWAEFFLEESARISSVAGNNFFVVVFKKVKDGVKNRIDNRCTQNSSITTN